MIQRIMITFFWLPFAFKILSLLTYVESIPQTGVITGGFAGAPTSDRLIPNITNTTHPAEHLHESFPIIVPATTIQRGETFANGCFKQIIREPDYYDVKRYISTEQLICPPSVNITTISQQYHTSSNGTFLMPMLVQPNATGHPVAPPYANVYHTPAVLPIPVNATPIAVLPPPSMPSAPLPPVLTQQKDQPAVFQPRQPVMAEIPNVAASQVIVLSQKTGYYDAKRKTNAANTTLLAVNWNVIVIVMTIFTYFM